MTRRPIATAIAVFLVAFAVALRIFLSGHHAAALLIVVCVWAILAVWLRFGGAQ